MVMRAPREEPSSSQLADDRAYNGLFVVVLGVDGSGKSTLLRKAENRLAGYFPAIKRFHWRARLLPQPRGARQNSQPDQPQPPPKDFAYGRAVSLLRFSYHYIDFLLGYWFVIRPARKRGALVVVERWYLDTIVNPVRYGFRVPEWLLKVGGWLMPKPDLTLLLEAPAESIHARKPELSVEELRRQLLKLRAILPHTGRRISTAGNIDRSLEELVDAVLQAARVRAGPSNISADAPRDRWRAFPISGEAKLWIDEHDRVSNALHLYHPYSLTGRFAIRIMTLFPRWVTTRRMHDADGLQAGKIAVAIHTMLGHDDLTISFSTGTPNQHRKITAQVSRGENIIAYVKIGSSDAAKRLIQNETQALSHFDVTTLAREAMVPHVLAQSTFEDSLLLALSAPPSPGRQRSTALDERDVRFLASLVPAHMRTESPREALETIGVSKLSSIIDGTSSGLVMHACESVTALLERRGVRMAPAHGDYVPWNSLTMADGSLYVFDWEHSADAPLLFDFFHRVFMPDRLVGGGIPPHAAIKRLLASVDTPLVSPLKEKCGLEADELPAYLLLYLLKLAAREVLEKGEIDRYLLECMRLTLVLAGHPSHLKRVLVSAYACEPHKGSEPGVGWGWIQEITRENDTWVITRSNNREAIDAEMRANPNIHLHFAYVDLPVWARFWKRKHRGIRTYYYLWQFAAWRCARKLHREVHFDLAHHVTFVNDWLWTFLALMPLPYIWGPVGSNARCPSDLLPHTRARVADLLRIAVQNLVRWLDPLWWLSAVRASVIIAINQDVANALPLRSVAAHKLIVEHAIAIDNRQNEPITPVRDGTRILYVGRHLAVKGGSLAVEAFSRAAARFSSARLAMIGEGPEEGDLRERARRSGIGGRVDFIPWQPQERVWDYMGSSDIFLFPSMEGAGLAVLEAMRAGLPIVCLKFGGPGTMVTEETGCRVPLGPFDQVADGLATELIGLLADAARRARLGDASRRRAQSAYSWEAKRVFIRRLYRDVLYKPDRLIQLKDPVDGR